MFNFFKRNRSEIPVRQTTDGSHGDHWGAVFGFEGDEDLQEQVVAMAAEASVQGATRGYERLRYDEPPFLAFGIGSGSQLHTIYPALQVTEALPVTLKEIIEWKHVNGIEAQIVGSGRDTFGLNFFATDYLENRDNYRKGGIVQIALSGMAYVIKEATELPDDLAADFCSYMPNQELTGGDSFDFIGDVLAVESVTVRAEELQIARVKLINMEDNPEMFALPMLANPKNVRVDLSVGKKVSGCFWLTGSIV